MSAIHTIGYLRTSSATNVGEDKDSEPRQRAAILAGARRLGLEVVEWFYDAGISGDVPVSDRPGFTAMLDRIDGNGVRGRVELRLALARETATPRKAVWRALTSCNLPFS